MPEKEDPARVQSLVKALDRGFPGTRVEVDEHVAAKDHVDVAEHSKAILVEEVHLPEMAELANGLRHVPGAAAPLEEQGADFGRCRAKTALPVDAPAGRSDAAS